MLSLLKLLLFANIIIPLNVFNNFCHSQEMEQRGIGISAAGRDAIKARLSTEVDASVEEALERVCSGNLIFQPLPREVQEPYVSPQLFFPYNLV